jgi:gluconolactonase
VSQASAPSVPDALESPPLASPDASFQAALASGPRPTLVLECDAHEGPVYVAEEDALYFTSLPRPGSAIGPGGPMVEIRRLALDGTRFPLESERLSTVRADANAANGMTLDRSDRLVVCEQGSRSRAAAITRLDRERGEVELLVNGLGNSPLNSPNDVVVKSDGTIWFTDPSYGHLQGFRPKPALRDGIYRHEPSTGRLSVVAQSLDKPNGLAFSPDERIVYVTDSGANQEPESYYPERPHEVVAFDVAGERLSNRRRFAEISPGFPDGIKVDSAGRVYVSSASGVQIFSADGTPIGEIVLPGAVNFCFGGRRDDVLFITADEAIWAVALGSAGASAATEKQLKGV